MSKLIINMFNLENDLENFDSYLLIVDNKKVLYSILQSLYTQNSDSFIKIIDNSENQLKTFDYIEFVSLILDLDVNCRKNINAVMRLIKSCEKDTLKKYINDFTEIISKCFNDIKINMPISICSDLSEISEDDILKLMNIFIEDSSNNPLERINNYINVIYELKNIRIFIFYSLYSFLDKSEIDQLIKFQKYNGIKIIDIEPFDQKLDVFDHKKILDNDICLLE